MCGRPPGDTAVPARQVLAEAAARTYFSFFNYASVRLGATRRSCVTGRGITRQSLGRKGTNVCETWWRRQLVMQNSGFAVTGLPGCDYDNAA